MTMVRQLIDCEEKWTQDALARDQQGIGCGPWAPMACCWCLAGGLRRCYSSVDQLNAAHDAVALACEQLYGTRNFVGWQDDRKTTWPMVDRLLNEAGV